ncbi:MAG: L-threonylcarbamoyladenylate synthase [Ignavibacteria bacterium]|nr:L-threonylcarbamoyladenylate synthase [Ignavibacteria bacterium]
MKTIVTSSIKISAKYIKAGEIVGFPTETVYGLGANVFDENAVKKIFKVKNRPQDNPLIVHISKIADIELLVKKLTPSAEKIIEKFFPGPITIVIKKNEIISNYVTAGLDTIAIRMPGLDLTRRFIKECGVPIAAPSANISGSPSPTSWQHVYSDLNNKIPCILKGPNCKVGIESTVVDCTTSVPTILRPGSISIDALKEIFPQVRIASIKLKGKVKSPGMKYKHYSPKAKVVLVENMEEVLKIVTRTSMRNFAFIGFDRLPLARKCKVVNSLNDYAHKLFGFFRQCDEMGIKKIFCQIVNEEGIGLALMNRLIKASHS